ncbi:TetR/AcrR family transcriptional regulator [Leptospira sp. 96542]|nr:TetR/AcrR family transcriptional regulator [Leptospira sp. 96542]
MAKITKVEILKFASQFLEEVGIKNFSMRNLGKKLGLDPMAIYHYFPSKDVLISECIQSNFEKFIFKESQLAKKSKKNLKTRKFAKRKFDEYKFQNLYNLIGSYRQFFLTYPNACLYLLNHGYENIPNLSEYNEALIQEILNLDGEISNATLIRDVLVDYLHGYSIGDIVSQRKTSSKRKESERRFDISLEFLIQRLFSKL